jgi:hypothetical protein
MFMQQSSFLAHQRFLAEKQRLHNLASLFGVIHLPSDNQIHNTLKIKGYHLSHHFGHGKRYLAQCLASLRVSHDTLNYRIGKAGLRP